MAEPEQPANTGAGSSQIDQEWAQAYMSTTQPAPGQIVRPRPKKKSGGGNMPLLLALLVIIGVAGYFVFKNQSQVKAKNDMNDLGQGVSTASGIRGHLVTRFEKDQTRYMLKIEPIDPRQAGTFDAVTNAPRQPLSITVRVLDATGFALCGKEILLPFDPARATAAANPRAGAKKVDVAATEDLTQAVAQEQSREKGHDMFRRIYDENGKVEGLWAEGTLPCSPDQYARSDYWDLMTTFPSLADLNPAPSANKAEPKQAEDEDNRRPAKKKTPKPATSSFYEAGDDYAGTFEAGRGILWAGPGHHFTILRKTDEATVAAWADDGALIHFKCDAHAMCSLNRAGSSTVVPARMNE
jgi:hypothetical protein